MLLSSILLVGLKVDSANADDRSKMAAAWQRIMDDLERVVRENAVSGPGIDGSFSDYGIEPSATIAKLRERAPQSSKEELDLLERNFSYKSAGDLYQDEYQLKVSSSEFDRRMWNQFQKSFNREIRSLPKSASGLLMAKFATKWSLRPPAFTSPLVFYSWAGGDRGGLKIHKLAQLTIWKTGNSAAIEEFVPSLLTNRMGGYALHDGFQKATGEKESPHPSSQIEDWLKKFPNETTRALEITERAIATGDLKKSEIFVGEAEDVWRALPNHEIMGAIVHLRKQNCVRMYGSIGSPKDQ